MNPRETALSALMATVLSLVVCQVLVQLGGRRVHLTGAEAMSGLAICLAGVAVGLLIVLTVSAFQESESRLGRSLGAFGLALGCALLLALLVGHRPARAATHQSLQTPSHVSSGTTLLARGTWR
ncbi:MAG TPA: hypothetical protein VER96_39865 [Polyangiaceae bacterium]|nr:hypothetical protein [Polyangiaceae bacterium]